MNVKVLVTVAAVLLAAADAPDEEAVKKEIEKLQGTWVLQAVENNGVKIPDGKLKGFGFRMTVKGDKYVQTVKGMTIRDVTFQIDPGKKPKTIDARDKDNKTEKGIYALDGDTLKLCMAEPEKERPADFVAKSGTNCSLMVFARETKKSD